MNKSPEFPFPTSSGGQFISPEETARLDALEIERISKETKAMPHLIKKIDGEWLVDGKTIKDYIEFWSGNDNSDMYKR